MTETAYFIEDRARILAYEATRYPATAPVALIWLGRATGWAKRRGMWRLATTLRAVAKRIKAARVPA